MECTNSETLWTAYAWVQEYLCVWDAVIKVYHVPWSSLLPTHCMLYQRTILLPTASSNDSNWANNLNERYWFVSCFSASFSCSSTSSWTPSRLWWRLHSSSSNSSSSNKPHQRNRNSSHDALASTYPFTLSYNIKLEDAWTNLSK